MHHTIIRIFIIASWLFVLSCDSKPKVIVAEDTASESNSEMADASASELHKVVAGEILHTSRYTYMNVTENGQTFWVALPKKEVESGKTYYYRGGLKKVNFKSIEHDRVFDVVYLVSDVSTEPGMSGLPAGHPDIEAASTTQTGKLDPPPGGITIAELFNNKKKYEGQTVRVKGKCVKLNNMIMNRNWIHIQDGTVDKADLTITTTDNVILGDVVAFEGKITLNKDFGAGYKYDIIMEEAHLLH